MNRRFIFLTFTYFVTGTSALWGQVLTGAHDPTVMKDSRCVYSLLSTNNLLQIRQSTDEINWKVIGNIFTAVPAWINTALGATIADIWAPCIRYNNGLYWVYYAGSSFGTNNSVIGVASNPTLDPASASYHWTDHGLVIQSGSANNYNCIDPDMFVDTNNNVWLAFGSFWSGIKMIAIDPATGKQLATNTTIYSLASRGGGAIEGGSLIQHGGFYYLFTSWDTCCQGVNSTYNTRMGRATNITGPYSDEAGTALMSSGGTQLLSSYAQYIGPGGGETFQDGRRSYFAHHYYDANHAGAPELQIREIVFDNNGWCHITQPYLGRHEAFEAEHAHLANVAVSQTASASNGDYVAGITAAGSQVVFYINALAAGNYEADIRYANTGTAASQLLSVNSNPAVSVAYPSTGGTLQFSAAQAVTVNVVLVEGYNVLTFQPGMGSVALDRMDLIRLAGDVTAAGSDDHDCSLVYQPTDNSAVFSPGGDAQYENLDFKTGGYTSLSVYFSGACTGPVTFTLDSLGGALIAAANVTATGPQTMVLALPAAFKSTTGVHDVFAQFEGTGSCAVGGFQFMAQLGTPTSTLTPTGTFTATATRTNTPTSTSTASFTTTSTLSFTSTHTATPTNTSTSTPTRTTSMTASFTPSATTSFTATPSITPTFTRTFTSTPTLTNSPTSTSTPTLTNTYSRTPTASPTFTLSSTNTAFFTTTSTNSFTSTPTKTYSPTNTFTLTSTNSSTSTNTATRTPTASPTITATPTGISSPTSTSSFTESPTNSGTPTGTATASITRTATPSATASWTPTASLTSTATPSLTASSSMTPTASLTTTWTASFTASPTASQTLTATTTSTPTYTPTNTVSSTATPSFTSTPTNSGTPTKTFTNGATATLSPTRTATFTSTLTPTPSPSATPTVSPTASFSVTSTLTSTVTASFTATATSTNLSTATASATSTATPTGTPEPPTPSPTAIETATATLSSGAPLLFPNPVTSGDSVKIHLPSSFSPDVTIKIFTSAFRKVQQQTYEEPVTKENLLLTDRNGMPLANGLYYVVVIIGKQQWILKLVILK